MVFKDMHEADSAPLGAVKNTQLLEHGTARCGRCNAAVAPPGFGTAQYLDEGLFQLPRGLAWMVKTTFSLYFKLFGSSY